MKISDLHVLVAAVCPIDGIDSAGGIQFKPEATPTQMRAAQAAMDANLGSLVL